MEFKNIASNQKAYRDFHILEKIECGISLIGAEVKSLRAGHADFKGSFAVIHDEEVYVYNLYINPYLQASYENEEPGRKRKLLLHKKEIKKLLGKTAQRGFNLIPTRIYFNKRGIVKIEIALGQPKKLYDKREDIKQRDIKREINRQLKNKKK